MVKSTPKKETQESIYRALNDIRCGMRVKEACIRNGTSERIFYYHINRNEDLKQQYVTAMKLRADIQFELMEELERLVLEGKMNPVEYSAVARSMRWRLSKMRPSTYGTKKQAQVKKETSIAEVITAARHSDPTGDEHKTDHKSVDSDIALLINKERCLKKK